MMFDPNAPVEVVTLRDERASEADAIGRVIRAAFAGEPQGGRVPQRPTLVGLSHETTMPPEGGIVIRV